MKIFKVFIITFIIISFLTESIPVYPHPNSVDFLASVIHPTPSMDFYIPSYYGEITRISSGMPDVIVITDAHCNYSIQKNIASILRILLSQYGVGFIGVEGAKQIVDVSRFNRFKDERKKEKILDRFVKEGYVTGPEFIKIVKGENIPVEIVGLEDTIIYKANFDALKNVLEKWDKWEEILNKAKDTLEGLKDRFYNSELKKLDQDVLRYWMGEIPLTDFIWTRCRFFQSGVYPNIEGVVRCLELEKKLDFKKAEKEREWIISRLVDKLPTEDVQGIVKKGLEYKLGKIPASVYYGYICQYTDFNDTPNLKLYVELVNRYKDINKEALLNEIEEAIESIYKSLANNEEIEIVRLNKDLYILDKALHLKLNAMEYEYYKNRLNRALLRKIILAPLDDLLDIDSFYAYARQRDSILVEALLREKGDKRAVVIAGGFHTDGITRLLEEKGIAYAVIRPNMTEAKEGVYFSLLKEGIGNEDIALPPLIDPCNETTKAVGMDRLAENIVSQIEKELSPKGTVEPLINSNPAVATMGMYTKEQYQKMDRWISSVIRKLQVINVKDIRPDVWNNLDKETKKVLKEVRICLLPPEKPEYPYYLRVEGIGRSLEYQVAYVGVNKGRYICMTRPAFMELPLDLVCRILKRGAKLVSERHAQNCSICGYDEEVKEILMDIDRYLQLNPDEKDLIGIYGGAGADISHLLLSTNADSFQNLEIELIEDNFGVLPGYLRQRIIDTIKWNIPTASTDVIGRSILVRLGNPIEIDGRKIRAIKIKGIVYKDEDGRISPPIMEEYNGIMQRQYYFKWKDGRIVKEKVSPRAKGGVELSKAKNEFNMARDLWNLGLGGVYPIGYGRYTSPSMRFNNKEMGFVILGIEDENDRRLGGQFRREYVLLFEDKSLRDFLIYYSWVMYKVGRRLRELHEQGFVHDSLHLNNMGLIGKEIYFFDLSTSRRKLKDESDEEFLFYQFLDYVSILHSLHRHLIPILTGKRFRWNEYIEEFCELTEGEGIYPNYAFMSGYFYDIPELKYTPGDVVTDKQRQSFDYIANFYLVEADKESFQIWEKYRIQDSSSGLFKGLRLPLVPDPVEIKKAQLLEFLELLNIDETDEPFLKVLIETVFIRVIMDGKVYLSLDEIIRLYLIPQLIGESELKTSASKYIGLFSKKLWELNEIGIRLKDALLQVFTLNTIQEDLGPKEKRDISRLQYEIIDGPIDREIVYITSDGKICIDKGFINDMGMIYFRNNMRMRIRFRDKDISTTLLKTLFFGIAIHEIRGHLQPDGSTDTDEVNALIQTGSRYLPINLAVLFWYFNFYRIRRTDCSWGEVKKTMEEFLSFQYNPILEWMSNDLKAKIIEIVCKINTAWQEGKREIDIDLKDWQKGSIPLKRAKGVEIDLPPDLTKEYAYNLANRFLELGFQQDLPLAKAIIERFGLDGLKDRYKDCLDYKSRVYRAYDALRKGLVGIAEAIYETAKKELDLPGMDAVQGWLLRYMFEMSNFIMLPVNKQMDEISYLLELEERSLNEDRLTHSFMNIYPFYPLDMAEGYISICKVQGELLMRLNLLKTRIMARDRELYLGALTSLRNGDIKDAMDRWQWIRNPELREKLLTQVHIMEISRPSWQEDSTIFDKIRSDLNNLGYGRRADEIVEKLVEIIRKDAISKVDYDFILALEEFLGYPKGVISNGMNIRYLKPNTDPAVLDFLETFRSILNQWGFLGLMKDIHPKGMIVQDITDLGCGLQNWLEGIRRYNIDVSGVQMAYLIDGISKEEREFLFSRKPPNVILLEEIKGKNVVYLARRDRLERYKGVPGIKLVEAGNAGPLIELSLCLWLLESDDLKEFNEKLVSFGIREGIKVDPNGYIRLPRIEKALRLWNELEEGGSYLSIWA